MTREIMRQALDILHDCFPVSDFRETQDEYNERIRKYSEAITALEAELSKPVPQPVGMLKRTPTGQIYTVWGGKHAVSLLDLSSLVDQPLYIAPVDQSERIKSLEADNERLRDQVERLAIDLALKDGK